MHEQWNVNFCPEFMRKRNYILFVLLILASLAEARALAIIHKIEINPLNRVVMSFNELPDQAFVKFSDDKRKITISIPGGDFGENVTDAHGKGIVQEVFVQLVDDTLIVSAILKEARGYTLTRLPYTKKIVLETFKWDQLEKDEDSYRLGLISLFDRIYPAAKDYLESAANMDNIEAKAQLGILLLRSGKTSEAEKYLSLSLKIADKTPDIYAALSQAYQIQGNSEEALKYARLFSEKTGMDTFDNLETDLNIADNDNSGEPSSLLNTFDSAEEQKKDTVTTDSTDAELVQADSSMAESDSPDKTESKGLMPEWLSSILIYVIVFGGIMLVILVSSYLKWRKQKISKIRSSKGKKFDDKLKKAGKGLKSEKLKEMDRKGTTATQAANAYKKAAEAAEQKKSEQIKEEEKKFGPPAGSNKLMSEKLDKIARELTKNRADIDDSSLKETPKNPVNAKLQLALHLQEEQNRLKNKSKADFNSSGFTADSKKLAEIAEKLGIEKDKVNKEDKTPKISSDKESLSKLAEKFKGGKKK